MACFAFKQFISQLTLTIGTIALLRLSIGAQRLLRLHDKMIYSNFGMKTVVTHCVSCSSLCDARVILK